MTLLELAERCEQATGPDRDLDEQLHFAAGYRLVLPDANERLQHRMRWLAPDGFRAGWIHKPDSDYPPSYTSSLDAAMTLKPDSLMFIMSGGANCRATADLCVDGENETVGYGEGVAPALALCAAALRARAA